MKIFTSTCLCVLSICCCVACESPTRKVETKKQEAATKINEAEQNLNAVRADDQKKIAAAQGSDAVEKAKINATKDIAEAKRELGDQKVKATEKITDAEQKAKVDPSPQLP